MAHFIAVAASPSMLGAVTPNLDGDLAKEKSPIDASKLSDFITVWDSNLVMWFEWKKKFLTKCQQNPEFEKFYWTKKKLRRTIGVPLFFLHFYGKDRRRPSPYGRIDSKRQTVGL
jgi:hypothetical protein